MAVLAEDRQEGVGLIGEDPVRDEEDERVGGEDAAVAPPHPPFERPAGNRPAKSVQEACRLHSQRTHGPFRSAASSVSWIAFTTVIEVATRR